MFIKKLIFVIGLGLILAAPGGCALIEEPAGEELIVEQQEEIKTLEEREAELEEEIERLEAVLAARDEDIDRLQAQIEAPEEKRKRLEELREENIRLEESLEEIRKAETRRVGEDVIVTLDAEILFDFGDPELRAQSRRTLDELGEIIAEYSDRPIVVEGHTDNIPVKPGSRFPTNWHLSAARAVSVVDYLVEEHNLTPEQFFAGGYGEYRPVKPNDSEENRAKNRRVEINFLPPDLEEEVIKPGR